MRLEDAAIYGWRNHISCAFRANSEISDLKRKKLSNTAFVVATVEHFLYDFGESIIYGKS